MKRQDQAKVAETHGFGSVLVEIVEWNELRGMADPDGMDRLALARQAGVAARQVRISLSGNDEIVTEAGALQFHSGKIEIRNEIPAGKILGRLFGAAVTGEAVFRPSYRGTGEIWLEPTFGHFVVVGLDSETVIVDQGAFHLAGSGVKVEAKAQKNLSSAIFGGEGLFQTALTGPGFCVLQSKVPESELVKIFVEPGEKCVVDGSFALLRTANLDFSVGKSARGWVGTALSGEGLLSTFENRSKRQGEVWISPLEPIYASFSPRPRPQEKKQ